MRNEKTKEFYYSTKAPNHKKTGGGGETFKRRDGIRTNVKANLRFWGGKSKTIIWPDGSLETITV